MTVKEFSDRDDIESLLFKRKLIFSSDELQKVLKNNNYFNFFNGFESLLLYQRSPKLFKGETLSDFIRVNNFDKELSKEILSLTKTIESKLKNSIAYHFSWKYCNTIPKTMEYTNKQNFLDPRDVLNYPFRDAQNWKICNDFDEFYLFKAKYSRKLMRENDHITVSIYSHNKRALIPFWVAIETLEFGAVIRLLHYLDREVMQAVMKDFNLPISDRFTFLNMIDLIKELRNHCAHGSLACRFRSAKKIHLDRTLIHRFKLEPKYHNQGNNFSPSVISLFDTLKVINYFTDTKKVYKIIQKVVYQNNRYFKGKYDLNERLLSRMGETQLKKWKDVLK